MSQGERLAMNIRQSFGLLAAVLLLIATLGVVNAVSIYQYSLLSETQRADCAIVAGAGIADSQPSPVFKERLNHAFALYRQGYAPIIILTGGTSAGSSLSDAAIARTYLLTKGVSEKAILLEEKSRVTRENFRYARQIMAAHHLRTALLVSDPLHMKRAMLIARDEGIDARPSPTPTTRYRSFEARLSFLIRETFYYSGYQLLRLKQRLISTV